MTFVCGICGLPAISVFLDDEREQEVHVCRHHSDLVLLMLDALYKIELDKPLIRRRKK